ncbi:MAG: HNH endonuclease signature motif containing protein [bacterium]|nr:HNH endonuclease signature motif containing protein [bacterium]
MELTGVAAALAPDCATPLLEVSNPEMSSPEVPSAAAEPAAPTELGGAVRSGDAENVAPGVAGAARLGHGPDVAPEVVVVGACDGPGRVTALVDALLAELRALSLEGAGRGVLRGLVATLGRVRAGADAAEARVVAAVERLDDGGVDAVEVLRRNAGSSQREAQRRKHRAEALGAMPNIAGALAAGEISAEHAEALARAAGATSAEAVDGDAELLAQVAGVPADRAGRYIQEWTQRNQDPADLHEQHLRQRRRRRLNFGDGDDGMLMAHAAFDRVLGAQFRSLINGIADRIWRAEGGRDNPDSRSAEQRRLDALAIAVGLESEPEAAVGVAAAPSGAAGALGAEGPGVAVGAEDPGVAVGAEGAVRRDEALEPDGAATPDDVAALDHVEAGVSDRSRLAGSPATSATRGNANRPPAPATRGNANRPAAPDSHADGSQPATPATRADGSGSTARSRPVSPRHQIVIVASADVVAGIDPQGRCEIPGIGPIPQSELERLACDAELFGLLFSGEGEPLWHGRGERTATDAQRRALIARDGGCVLCAEEPSRCESHHVVPWARPTEGPTDIDNLALLCGTCHRRLHNNKLILTRSPDGTWGTAPDPRYTGRANGNAPHLHAVDAPAPRQRGP